MAAETVPELEGAFRILAVCFPTPAVNFQIRAASFPIQAAKYSRLALLRPLSTINSA